MRAAEVCTKNLESCSAPISIARWKLAENIFMMAAPWNAQEILKSYFFLTDGAESTVLSTTVMLMGQRFPRVCILYQFNQVQGNALHWLHGAQIDPCTRRITCCVLRERTKSLPPYVQYSVLIPRISITENHIDQHELSMERWDLSGAYIAPCRKSWAFYYQGATGIEPGSLILKLHLAPHGCQCFKLLLT